MAYVNIGACSLCGGAVMAYQGAWMSTLPPPPPKCSGCGAVPKGNVVETVHPRPSAGRPADYGYHGEYSGGEP